MSQKNVEIVRQANEAFNRGGIEEVRRALMASELATW